MGFVAASSGVVLACAKNEGFSPFFEGQITRDQSCGCDEGGLLQLSA